MFTPPPSPVPTPEKTSREPKTTAEAVVPPNTQEQKRRKGRRMKWAVLLVPAAIILITASTRYLTHPIAFDLLLKNPSGISWNSLNLSSLWEPHEKHKLDEPAGEAVRVRPHDLVPRAPQNPPASSSSSSTAAATKTTTAPQPLPTVPSSPPVLPVPFPQAFDSTLTKNFSSVSCYNFFNDMIVAPNFRSCRSFALLMLSSNEFLNAQQNSTLMNSIIWGTCNTTVPEDQCTKNMNGFASQLQSACAADLRDRNTMATSTLIGLQSFQVMRDAGCMADPTTNSYCTLNAVRNSNPSDFYVYQLPLGTSFPATSTPSCSACTRSILGQYHVALKDPNQAPGLAGGLKLTYDSAANAAIHACGADYAQALVAGAGMLVVKRGVMVLTVALTVVSAMGWVV